MKTINYERDGWRCITPCPYNKRNGGNMIHVGSCSCGCCSHCKSCNNESKTVTCSFEEDTNNNNK